ncbi:MAG: RodZ family helix-turn-helix domain-containing protein [Pseudomonadota bacterium]
MDIADDTAGNESRPTGVGPGERLQAARIEQGLSVKDVANRMHLSTAILESIEENNFDEITAPIFVKGYLRAYARIVSLNEDEMIQQYVDFYSNEDPPITSTSNMAPELTVTDARMKWMTYLVVIGIVALVVVWWWNKEANQTAASNSAQQELAEEVINAEVSVVVNEPEVIDEDPVEIAESPEPTEVSEQPEIGSESETAANDGVENDGVEDTQIEALDVVTQSDSATGVAVTSQSEPVESGDRFVGTRAAPSGSDELLLIVHADTWADIKDSGDYQLVYDLLRAGQSVNLTGDAPFAVFFGNGHGVEVSVNGVEVSLASNIRDDNTARLSVGQ